MKKIVTSTILLMLFLASISTVVTMVKAQPPEVWVPTQYPTIQEGIAAVAEYGIVHVLAGTYKEHVTINKPVTLAGENKTTTIIDGSGTGNVIYVTFAHHVKITGFSVRNGVRGIFISWTNYYLIENCDTFDNVYGDGVGINIDCSSHGIIANCNTYSNKWGGIICYALFHENLTITHCNAYSNIGCGILLGYYVYSTIEHCNTYSNGGAGIDVDCAQYSTIKNCNISTNNVHGISFWGPVPAYNNITNNTIDSNKDTGIILGGYASQYNTITDNIISNNSYGLRIGPDPDYVHNKIYHNNFINNGYQAIDDGIDNEWDNGYPSGGNYWSNYTGVDLYSGPYQNETGNDGIGDAPYVIDADSQDNYPLMHPYGSIRNLDTGLTYLTIQSAIDASQTLDGHTILVGAGTFAESVSVHKQLNIMGAGVEVTLVKFDPGGPHNHIFEVTAHYVNISGFTITSPTNVGTGLEVLYVDHVTISSNQFANLSYCVYVGGTGNYINISNNLLEDNNYGIVFGQTGPLYSYNTIANNTLINNRIGAINFNELFKSTVKDNKISMGATDYAGIWLGEDSRDNIVFNNVIEGTTYAIRLITVNNRPPNNNIITNNTVKFNTYGIGIDVFFGDPVKPSNNTIYHNNILNNTIQAYSVSEAINSWDGGYPCGGNYWSDYTGQDIYSGQYQNETGSDVIGDIPYKIDDQNWDRYPLTKWPPPSTKTTLSINPNPVISGQTVTLLGNLTTIDNDPIPGAPVKVKLNGVLVTTLVTNSTGWFEASGQVTSAGNFNISVEYAGSIQYLPSLDWEILVVSKAKSMTYFIFTPNPVNPGENCTLKGILLDEFINPIRFAALTLEYSIDYGSTWNPAGTLTTNSYGIFSKGFKAPSSGVYVVRIKYAGSSSYEPSTADVPLIVR